MRKIFCDICGKEIDPCNETWRQQLCHENSLLCVDDEIA